MYFSSSSFSLPYTSTTLLLALSSPTPRVRSIDYLVCLCMHIVFSSLVSSLAQSFPQTNPLSAFFPYHQSLKKSRMCIHTILHHVCGHLSWCPDLLQKCRDLKNNLGSYKDQQQNWRSPGESSWPETMPRPCPILWPIGTAPDGSQMWGLRTAYVRPDVLESRVIFWQQEVEALDGLEYQPQGEVLNCPEDLIQPCYAENTNARIRWVPYNCGCQDTSDPENRLARHERHMAMAYEFGLVSLREILIMSCRESD